jgi:hypothetical protein
MVLNHVLRVNAVEKALQELLSSLQVEISGHEHAEEQPIGG